MSQPLWTALVVEDEPRLREALVEHLHRAAFPFNDILQARDGEEALALCRNQRPDVAFLDIRMPGMSGLELAARLPPGVHLVFITAYDAHALEAFEAGAIDYLLKPIAPDRLQKTLERLRARAPMDLATLQRWLGSWAPRPLEPPREPLRWITAKSGRHTHWIAVEDVLYFQADTKVTKVVCASATHLIDTPIKALAETLDAAEFQQIHRATLVNLKAVGWVERQEGGQGILHLKNHAVPLPISASYFKALMERR